MNKGLFVSIEGLDGSGKTTQINKIKDYVESKGYQTLIVREPGGTIIGEKVRDILLDNNHLEMTSVAEMLLYASSRAQLFEEKIKPYLDKGFCVICDRFVDSSVAYQGYGRLIDPKKVLETNLIAINNRMPDITFYLDIDPEESLQRRFNATKTDRLENEAMEFHHRVSEGYKTICKENKSRIVKINATNKINDISEVIYKKLDKVIERNDLWN